MDLVQCSRTSWKMVPSVRWIASRTYNSADRNYSQLDKEGAEIMFVLKKFHKQIYGRCFVIMTNHKPLVSLFGELKQVPITASPRVQRAGGGGDHSAWVRIQEPLQGWQKPWQCGLSK